MEAFWIGLESIKRIRTVIRKKFQSSVVYLSNVHQMWGVSYCNVVRTLEAKGDQEFPKR